MRYILLLCFAMLTFAQNITVIAIPDRTNLLSVETMDSLKMELQKELSYFKEDIQIKILPNISADFKRNYAQKGFEYLKGVALDNQSEALILLEYKKGARSILVRLFIADGTNTSKNSSVRYNKQLEKYLSEMLSDKILKLFMETGTINENNRYL